jgi:hypothetical protein
MCTQARENGMPAGSGSDRTVKPFSSSASAPATKAHARAVLLLNGLS